MARVAGRGKDAAGGAPIGSSGGDDGPLRHRSPVDQRGYTMLLNVVLYDRELSDGAKVTYMALLDHARQADACWPGQERLAEQRGVSDRTVRNHIAELQARGLLTVERRGLNQTNLYWVEDLRAVYDRPQEAVEAVGAMEGTTRATRTGRGESTGHERDRKNFSGPERKISSGQERKRISVQDRQLSSDEEDTVRNRPSRKKTATAERTLTAVPSAPPGDPAAVAPLPSAPVPDPADPEHVALVKALADAGLNRADAERLAAAVPDECRRQLGFLPYVAEFKTSRGAYLRTAIEQGFAPPRGWQEAHQRARAAQEGRQRAQGGISAARQREEAEGQRRAALEAEKARLQSEEPARWADVVARAEGMLPPPLRGRTGHVAYGPALQGNIERLVQEGLPERVREAVTA